MYDELVRCLRHCVDAPEHRGCAANCKYGKEHPLNYLCISAMMQEAADAIEELSKPRWIPVAERLPEEYKDVLCYYEYFRYGDYNCMFRTIDRGYYGNGIWGGEAGQGHKNKVLAWMPLPQPPKEGEI